jgi:hypothetical protein
MDCRAFLNRHVAFVDDVLPAFEMDAMQQHLTACSRCSRHDTRIRRSLMLVRSLPEIEPSPEFIRRLNARLARMSPADREDVFAPRRHWRSAGSIAALAAGIVAVAYMAVETNNYFAAPASLVTPAVAVATVEPLSQDSVAPADASPANSISDAALVASVPTGIPVWPAVLMVGQSPMHFASMEFREGDRSR